jgi:hypothetical protein
MITRYWPDAEHVCVGFWPGHGQYPEPAFFAYALPRPEGIEQAPLAPVAAGWSAELGEFLLPYDAVRTAPDARGALLDFLETTYQAAAGLARWDASLVAPLDAGREPGARS